MELELAQVGAFLGAAISVGLASLSAGFSEGYTAGYALNAMGRQPAASGMLTRSMIISMCVTETGPIFCLVVSILLIFGGFLDGGVDYAKAGALLAAGIVVGFGTMGPNLGAGYNGAEACRGLGRTPSEHLPQTTNMLLGQAMAQTPSIYALVVAMLLLYVVPGVSEDQTVAQQISRAFAYLGAALALGIGTFGAGVGSGWATGLTSKMMSRHLEQKSLFMRLTLLTSAIAQTTAIYAMVIAFLLVLM